MGQIDGFKRNREAGRREKRMQGGENTWDVRDSKQWLSWIQTEEWILHCKNHQKVLKRALTDITSAWNVTSIEARTLVFCILRAWHGKYFKKKICGMSNYGNSIWAGMPYLPMSPWAHLRKSSFTLSPSIDAI